jgi:hypothetical protein
VTDSTSQVLASIDETLDGYVTWDGRSADAMRWTAGGRSPRMRVTVQQPDPEALARSVRLIGDAMRLQAESLKSAFTSIAKMFKGVVNANHPSLAPAIYGDDYRRHRRACRRCNPAGNPKPLRVNGADYQRRTRSRRHRNRR